VPVSWFGAFATGMVADAPPVMAKETPATLISGNAVFPRFRLEACFAFAIVKPPGRGTLW
jgi:hypothetical protein